MDRVYFTGPHAPGGQTWLHCRVQRVDPAGVQVEVQVGYDTQKQFYPMQQVSRIEYDNHRR